VIAASGTAPGPKIGQRGIEIVSLEFVQREIFAWRVLIDLRVGQAEALRGYAARPLTLLRATSLALQGRVKARPSNA
jgi:hypothetical protein